MNICVCCGEHYFDRGKDSLCPKCDGDGWRQNKYRFTGELEEHPLYEFKPTEKYYEIRFKKDIQ